MRRAARVSLGRLPAGAVMLALALASCTPQPPMSQADAREFTRRALTEAGFSNVGVELEVTRGSYQSPDPRFQHQKPIDVMATRALVPGGSVELFVERDGDRAVFVRDTADSGGRLLTDDQFSRLARFRYDPATERQRPARRAATLAATVLVVAVATWLLSTVLTGGLDRRRWRHARRR